MAIKSVLPDYPYVCVIWKDAHGSANAEIAPTEFSTKPALFAFFGFLLKDDEDGILLGNEFSEEGNARQWGVIPRNMIDQVIPFKLALSRKKKEPVP